jgi:hypothetical protein
LLEWRIFAFAAIQNIDLHLLVRHLFRHLLRLPKYKNKL